MVWQVVADNNALVAFDLYIKLVLRPRDGTMHVRLDRQIVSAIAFDPRSNYRRTRSRWINVTGPYPAYFGAIRESGIAQRQVGQVNSLGVRHRRQSGRSGNGEHSCRLKGHDDHD